MSKPPNLLNDDGTASIATALMMSHHGFRRDLARFAQALERLQPGRVSRVEALREEWKSFRATLHGHHEAEDNGVFPSIAGQHESAKQTIEALTVDHRLIDPLLEQGDAAFGALPKTDASIAVVRELQQLLDPHLATEERELIPYLRDAKTFPPFPDDVIQVYAEGFAWSMQGIAPEVLGRVLAMLPEPLREAIPAARAAFDARCERVWGSAKTGVTHTPIPGPPEE